MDIQYAYNLERMLYFICNENCDTIRPLMMQLEEQFKYTEGARGVVLDSIIVQRMQEHFISCSVSDEQTLSTIRKVKNQYGILLCPHSAVGVYVGQNKFETIIEENATVCVLTAHPAKFEEAVKEATGSPPPFPKSVLDMKILPQKFELLRKENENWRNDWVQHLKNFVITKSN